MRIPTTRRLRVLARVAGRAVARRGAQQVGRARARPGVAATREAEPSLVVVRAVPAERKAAARATPAVGLVEWVKAVRAHRAVSAAEAPAASRSASSIPKTSRATRARKTIAATGVRNVAAEPATPPSNATASKASGVALTRTRASSTTGSVEKARAAKVARAPAERRAPAREVAAAPAESRRARRSYGVAGFFAHSPLDATATPAPAAVQGLPYVLPSQPHTGE